MVRCECTHKCWNLGNPECPRTAAERERDDLRAEVARLTAGILEARKAFNGEGSHSWDDGMVTLCALIGVSVLEHNPTPRTLAEMVGENRAFRAALAGEEVPE